MSKQKAHWAITIKEESFNSWSKAKQEEFLKFVGKYINQNGDRISMKYADTVYTLAIGFKEKEDANTSSTHWHCLFSCLPGRTCTAGRVRFVMEDYGFPIYHEYLQQIDTSPSIYMKYANKEQLDKSTDLDRKLEEEFNHLKSTKIVSRDMFMNYLCNKYGVTWITKNKTIIDTYCSMQDQCYKERMIVDEENEQELLSRIQSIVTKYHDNILYQLQKPGALQSKSEAINDVETDDIARYITLISLLPYLFQRVQNCIDFIPGLYFWGEANTGKSFIFQLGKSYKTIATDSTGIGKFKLETCESAFLMDDVKGDTIDNSAYMSTIRQLALGTYSRVKIHSETRMIKGFVAVTSNEKPAFLSKEYDEKNRDAWLRRFIVLNFRSNKDMEELIINGNEFEYKVSLKVIGPFFKNVCNELLSKYGESHMINKSLSKYLANMHIYIEDDTTEEESTEEDGPNLAYSVGHTNQAKRCADKTVEELLNDDFNTELGDLPIQETQTTSGVDTK